MHTSPSRDTEMSELLRRSLCRIIGHRLTRRRGIDAYGDPFRVCYCGRFDGFVSIFQPIPDDTQSR